MDRMIASMNPCCPTCKVSRKVFWSGITAEASLLGLLETGHDLQVPPSELIIMTCHLAGDSIADRLQLRIVAFVMRDVRILLQWFVVVQQARQPLPQLMDRIWLIRHSRFSNSWIFDLRQISFNVSWGSMERFLDGSGEPFSCGSDPIVKTHSARAPIKVPSWLVWVKCILTTQRAQDQPRPLIAVIRSRLELAVTYNRKMHELNMRIIMFTSRIWTTRLLV